MGAAQSTTIGSTPPPLRGTDTPSCSAAAAIIVLLLRGHERFATRVKTEEQDLMSPSERAVFFLVVDPSTIQTAVFSGHLRASGYVSAHRNHLTTACLVPPSLVVFTVFTRGWAAARPGSTKQESKRRPHHQKVYLEQAPQHLHPVALGPQRPVRRRGSLLHARPALRDGHGRESSPRVLRLSSRQTPKTPANSQHRTNPRWWSVCA